MEFFTKKDLDYYSSVIGPKYDKRSIEWDTIKNKLINNGVFDKTEHWAKLLQRLGYTFNFRYDWQISGKIRHYTWAKVYLKGQEDSRILFTVGVGSRVATGLKVHDLHFKLDCRRDKLSKYQVELFDNYIKSNNVNYLGIIRNENLKDYSWESLINETRDLFQSLEFHYLKLIDIIWPEGSHISPKVARICWNDLGWEKPSGKKGKSTNSDTFESKGYGHEEWLFDLDRVIDGYHYGFVQAFNKGQHYGKKFDLHLYTLKYVNASAQYFWAGRIKETAVLTKEEQESILKIYKGNGWYSEMMQELNDAGVKERDLEMVSEAELFNVKFKIDSDNFIKFDELKEITNPSEEIGLGYTRYGIKGLNKTTQTIINTSKNYKFRPGHNPTKTGTSKTKFVKRTINRTLNHKKIQESMFNQLVLVHGKDNVGTEVPTGFGTNIDVVVLQPDKSEWFYEVKTYNQPIICIREALGQVLEYAMFSKNNRADKLIVVGINKPNKLEHEYLDHLREVTKLKLFYQVFDFFKNQLINKLY
ncbi:hypothetical protein SAMN04487906_0492 [Zhouia amylolytica]|uniref:Uncharacterized protein n=1 Tax=Zhouia amylolytica TaxID=376730 RepID=A0A1I6PV92_9FLAO|nr:hypothetical protein [Zhouia amylolytica]SFS44082.1 hypothetical protein SAMN04487906_0492 [Zhouia amylolytica]